MASYTLEKYVNLVVCQPPGNQYVTHIISHEVVIFSVCVCVCARARTDHLGCVYLSTCVRVYIMAVIL